jgi:galactose mutarotase-like enzyme
VEVKNVGDKPEPVGIAWHPYFNLPSGDRRQARLHVSGDLRAEVNNDDDVFPTGKLLPVKNTPYDFTASGGAPLNDLFLDENWTNLKKAPDGSSYSEIIDPAAKYGLRIVALSRRVNTVQVYAPVDQPFVALEPQFNLNDPFGKEWGERDTGMVTLLPDQSVTWKVKLELFDPAI